MAAGPETGNSLYPQAWQLVEHSLPRRRPGAEIELSVLARQCLDRRIPDEETLVWEVVAGEEARNAQGNPVDWRFTTADARIKLKHLYPSIQE